MPETDDASRAPAAAWGNDGMIVRKNMPKGGDTKAFDFYYKHCSVNGNEIFYSKTSYDCTGPFY